MSDLPSSSTVVVKSVPNTEMVAEGVLMDMFSFFILPRLPLINLAVPLAIRNESLDLDGLGSKMYSSTTILECSVSFRTESSKNCIAIRPSPVLTSSLLSMPRDSSAKSLSSSVLRNTSPLPRSSDIEPISA